MGDIDVGFDMGFDLNELRALRDAFIFIRAERFLTETEAIIFNRVVDAIAWLEA